MPWLVKGDRVLASIEEMRTASSRLRGLLGRESLDGAVLLAPAKSVHTIGLRFPIDVIFCRNAESVSSATEGRVDAEASRSAYEVLDVVTMRRFRVARPRMSSCAVIEMPAGHAARLGVTPGDVVEVCHEREAS